MAISELMRIQDYYKGNNPGNIKVSSDWSGNFYLGKQYYAGFDKPEPRIKYKKFDTRAEGLADIINTVKKYDTDSLEEIVKSYASADESGERYKNYIKDLTEIYKVPKNINFSDDKQIVQLMKGITDIENPPDADDYYLDEDYIDAVKLIRQNELLTGKLGVM
jgi:hypothetical protein|tara:strand:- start:43 stop:531 length:489 start_codon:yes stop_codon:yes gene_type:complete